MIELEHARFLRPADVVAILGVSLTTVYDLLRAGELPGVKVGASWRIAEAELRAALERTRPVAAEKGGAWDSGRADRQVLEEEVEAVEAVREEVQEMM